MGTDVRRLSLRTGKIILDVSHDPRPFNILTTFGSVQANGTRLMVAAYESFTHVWALGPGVRISTRSRAPLAVRIRGRFMGYVQRESHSRSPSSRASRWMTRRYRM